MQITKYAIYGERCSGTNYLENLINLNFDIEHTDLYGHKHFFGFNDLTNSEDTIFIGIVRNPYDWINSLYRDQHHLHEIFKDVNVFLHNKFYSIDENQKEIINDRCIYNKRKRYNNIFEMRKTKLQFLIDEMPVKVKNYILIRHEDLINDFENTMNKIKQKGLTVKNNIHFPVNTIQYKKSNDIYLPNSKINFISKEQITNKLNLEYEKKK